MRHKLYENNGCPKGYKEINFAEVGNFEENDLNVEGDFYFLISPHKIIRYESLFLLKY